MRPHSNLYMETVIHTIISNPHFPLDKFSCCFIISSNSIVSLDENKPTQTAVVQLYAVSDVVQACTCGDIVQCVVQLTSSAPSLILGLLGSGFLPLQIPHSEPSQAPSCTWPGRLAAISEWPPKLSTRLEGQQRHAWMHLWLCLHMRQHCHHCPCFFSLWSDSASKTVSLLTHELVKYRWWDN